MKISNNSNTKIKIHDLPSEQDLKRQIMLTSAIVWKHELTNKELEKWLSNFKGEVFDKPYERSLALWLLANFVYYNENEVRHLCKTLYRDFIHKMLLEVNTSGLDIENSIKKILDTSRFYHLGRLGESGAYILYYFRQENELPLNNFIFYPDELPEKVKTIAYIDDVTLSVGQQGQAVGYIEKTREKYFKEKRCLLLTFIATDKTIEYLEKKGITVISSIILEERNKCFSKESIVFHYFNDHLEDCKKFAEHYGKKLRPRNPLGYNNSQFIFGFFYNTPDNSLPIFWAANNSWHPIIKRYDKNYVKENYIKLERFV